MSIFIFAISYVALLATFVPRVLFAATTTDSIIVSVSVVNPTTGGGGGGGCNPTCSSPTSLQITNVVTNPGHISADVSWETNLTSVAILEWGITGAYESGSSTIASPAILHSTTISGLQNNTQYFFRIRAAQDGNPNNTATYGGTFTTLGRTPPPNAINFTATYNPATGFIDLAWNNPLDADFDVVHIMRSTVFYPTDPTEGTFTYEGSAETDVDSNVSPGTWYYYTLFARDISGNYSSGVIARAHVPARENLPDEEPPPDEEVPPVIDEDPFAGIPSATSTDPAILALDIGLFRIIQNGKVTYFSGGTVEIDGTKPFSVAVDYDKLPEILKTIAVTLKRPNDPTKTFTFLLRVNEEKTEYNATVGPLDMPGLYPIFITVVDHKNQGIKRLQGTLDVSMFRIVVLPAKTKSLLKKLTPLGTIVGISALVSEVAMLALNVRSFYDLYLIFLRFIGFLLGFFGMKKKAKPWGTVYDSVTKRPLDPAYVVVRKGGVEVADAITDLDGRYGFLLPKGTYTLGANKTHYQFPSQTLRGKKADELYDNLYFGEEITTKEGEIITRNIPLDPVGFDWNEFVKNKKGLFQVFARREKFKTVLFNTLYIIGFASTTLAFIITPNLFNGFVFGSYIVLLALQIFWRYRHRAISVIDEEDHDPIPFAIVRLFLPGSNQEIKAVVADEWGRFYALVAPGRYYLTVETKQLDGSYKKVFQSPVFFLPKGVLHEDIIVNAKHIERTVRSWV